MEKEETPDELRKTNVEDGWPVNIGDALLLRWGLADVMFKVIEGVVEPSTTVEAVIVIEGVTDREDEFCPATKRVQSWMEIKNDVLTGFC